MRLSAAWADTTGCAYPATEPMESFVSSERLSGRKLEHAYGSYSAGAGVQLVFHIPQGRRCPVKTNWGTSEEYTLPHYLLGEFFGCTGASFFQLWVVALSDLSFFPSPSLLIIVSANVSLLLLLFFSGLFALLESLLVVRELGVQVTTKYVDGREKSTVRQTFDPPIKNVPGTA